MFVSRHWFTFRSQSRKPSFLPHHSMSSISTPSPHQPTFLSPLVVLMFSLAHPPSLSAMVFIEHVLCTGPALGLWAMSDTKFSLCGKYILVAEASWLSLGSWPMSSSAVQTFLQFSGQSETRSFHSSSRLNSTLSTKKDKVGRERKGLWYITLM